jgi:hypothetical protein
MILTIIGIYLLLGFIAVIIALVKEPLLAYAWWFAIIGLIIWPYLLWAVFSDDHTGRWI